MRKVRISKELRRRIRDQTAASGLRDPVAALIEGQWEDECEQTYHLAFYEREKIPTNGPIEVVNAGGTELLVVQDRLLSKLEAGILGLDGCSIVIEK